MTKFLRPRDFSTADRFLGAMFADSEDAGSFYKRAHRDQREALQADAKKAERNYNFPETWEEIKVDRRRVHYVSNASPARFIPLMKFGGKLVMTSDKGRILRKALLFAMVNLRIASPVDSGRYRRSHEIIIDGVAYPRVPDEDVLLRASDIAITNRLEYSSAQENPRWPRPYYKVFRALRIKDDIDVRLSFKSSDRVPGGLIPKTKKRGYIYNIPWLEIAPKGRLAGKKVGGLRVKRRRKANVRRGRSAKVRRTKLRT